MPVQAQRVGGGIATTHSQLGNGRWEVSSTLRPLYLRERPENHCTGDWVVLGARKASLPLGFDPGTVQPVATGYVDYAIPAPLSYIKVKFTLQ